MAQLHQFFRINFNLCQLYMCNSVFHLSPLYFTLSASILALFICLKFGVVHLPSLAFLRLPTVLASFTPFVLALIICPQPLSTLFFYFRLFISSFTPSPFPPYSTTTFSFPLFSFLFLTLLVSLSCFTTFPFYSTSFSF